MLLFRTLKEHDAYEKEIKMQSEKITKMKAEDAEFHDIKQQARTLVRVANLASCNETAAVRQLCSGLAFSLSDDMLTRSRFDRRRC